MLECRKPGSEHAPCLCPQESSAGLVALGAGFKVGLLRVKSPPLWMAHAYLRLGKIPESLLLLSCGDMLEGARK